MFALFTPAAVFAGDSDATSGKSVQINDADPFEDNLLGDWGGVRSTLADQGVTVNLDGNYSFQGVANGGLRRGSDYGNVFSGNLGILIDTGKAGLWPGGFLSMRAEGRGGESVVKRAGATSPVNNDALLPLIPGSLSDGGWGLTELTYAQFLSEQFGLVGGLINTDTGDANPIAGFLGSNAYFMNTAFLYSSVVGSTVPNVTLGGGVIFLPSESNHFKFLAVGSNETAGIDPFDNYEGTTFLAEWVTKYEVGGKSGGMTFTGTYSIDQERLRITEDPRILIRDFVVGESLHTDDDSWSVTWNGFQFLSGDETGGWGLFGRFGFSDGDPNPIRWAGSAGVGGVGLLPGRDKDRWGVGIYHQEFADGGVLGALGIDGETGGELFYNIHVCRGTSLTLDAQVIDSAIPSIDTIVVLGARLG
ncbi:MAG: carbohydrate porin, partial [Verrucomicrobiae bacterium]|nr:carbohydrate porin [Verrucomicrobiae bacterium]